MKSDTPPKFTPATKTYAVDGCHAYYTHTVFLNGAALSVTCTVDTIHFENRCIQHIDAELRIKIMREIERQLYPERA